MGELQDSLERAGAATATRPIPASAGARMRFLVRSEHGSTRAVAQRLQVSQRTVERYVKGTLRHPRPELAARLEREVRKDWQPRVRARARRHAATSGGIVVETRAQFGYTGAPGSSDQDRMRLLTQHLPPHHAERLFAAQAAGAGEDELRQVVAEALRDVYFRDRGRRARSLEEVRFTTIDYIELDF
ncbi:telomere-protecting terminal protein Tpg [Actinacidiphila rubida]|uniref:Telomere-protecting terminal protein n=1 Tax=Actinacidiphila rubida TaxID=310780 RepID=A0A1H8R8I8_9ACTN|nr:terminal protein TpgA2 [Actinacidiphila rubida]SEO62607.1 telomere-protecting terminal protein [Actinacidiphila rubida]